MPLAVGCSGAEDVMLRLNRLTSLSPRSVPNLLVQNVDRLHQAAGSRAMIDLLGVSTSFAAPLQDKPSSTSPRSNSTPLTARRRRRDQIDLSGFVVPRCASCGGILKQDVVFFGESVPRYQVAAAR